MANPIFDKESVKLVVVVFLFPLGTEEKSSDLSAYKRKAPMGGLLGKITSNIASFWQKISDSASDSVSVLLLSLYTSITTSMLLYPSNFVSWHR